MGVVWRSAPLIHFTIRQRRLACCVPDITLLARNVQTQAAQNAHLPTIDTIGTV